MKQLNILTLVFFFFVAHIVLSAVSIHADLPEDCAHETAAYTQTDSLPHTDFDGYNKETVSACLSCTHCFHFINQPSVFTVLRQEKIKFSRPRNEQLTPTYLSTLERPPRA